MKQNEALNLLKMGRNVFLTGEAGAGKTYVLNQYIHYLKTNEVKVAVTASTGIAATHLQGITLHAWSGIGLKEHLTKQDLEKLCLKKRIKHNYKKTKVLIIDEISMLHKHQLDMVDTIARYILESDKAFGGIQVVLCGDFFQLPPVSSSQLLTEKQFAFEAAAWHSGNFHVCYLHEQHRQKDDPLLTVLNDIRSGNAGEHTKVPLRTRYKKEPHGATKATKLYSRNVNVDAINAHELMSLPGTEKTFTMVTAGFSKLVEGLKKNCLAEAQLKLKIGAEVIFIKNDITNKYVNGTRAVVVGFDIKEGWPVVKTYQNDILIAKPEAWQYEENGIIRATITQVPLRLAWAITIHKSQGMTLDAAEIDLGDAFEPGMGYVALSRVRSLNGLKLMNLNEMALKVHPKILRHDPIFKENSYAALTYLQSLSEEELEKHQRTTLTERFSGLKAKTAPKATHKKKAPAKIPTHLMTLSLLKEKLPLAEIAIKREVGIRTIMGHLEKLVSLKMIQPVDIAYLKSILPEQDFELILAEFKQSEDGKLKPIYEKLNAQYPYEHIQLVRIFFELTCSKL